MNLEAARELKRRIRRISRRFALGISVLRAPHDYRVAILLANDHERELLASPVLQRAIRTAADEIDIEVTGIPRAASGTSIHSGRPEVLAIGASVGHHTGGVGSLGFFANRCSDGARGIVSCNHVIAMVDQGTHGDAIVAPSIVDRGGDVIATLDGNYPRLHAQPPADCAFAVIDNGIAFDAGSVAGGTLALHPAEITHEIEVAKIGRATRARTGVVAKIEVDDVWIRFGTMRVAFHDTIQIASSSTEPFAVHGDSGALVYTTSTFQPVGLLFAASYSGGPHGVGWAWAHPIRQVTSALGVDLVNA
jgi:hypothetical protein